MNETQSGPQATQAPAAITVKDILYVLFRHKWKIGIMCALGIAAAFALPLVKPAPYASEAKLFIKYVPQSKSPTQIGTTGTQVRPVDERGETIIASELEILTSLDVAQDAASVMGPEKILGKARARETNAAAAVIHNGLKADVAKKSSVIRVVFEHPNSDIVQPVLKQVIESYLKKTAESRVSGSGMDDVLMQESDQLHSRIVGTELDLLKARTNAGIISVEDSKKAYTEEISRIHQDIVNSEAELAQSRAAASYISRLLRNQPITATNEPAATNDIVVPSEKKTEYMRVCGLLDNLSKKEQELSVQFTGENALVKVVRDQIAANEKIKRSLENEYPSLIAVKVSTSSSKPDTPDPEAPQRLNLMAEMAKSAALESRIRVLTNQLAEVEARIARLDLAESNISDLQRKKALDETRYRLFQESLEQARIDERLGANRASGISKVQEASAPIHDLSKQLKMIVMILFASFGCALGLAFVLEFYVDQSLKRPVDVEKRLRLPLFITIPLVKTSRKALALAGKQVPLLSYHAESSTSGAQADADSSASQAQPSAAWPVELMSSAPVPAPFYDALRDRLMTFFEVKNLIHKPKLVALTSCGEGSGVSTVAAGLAAALSETGDGSVLLVDMNEANGAAHQFHRGNLELGLEEALAVDKRSDAQVQNNLYVVSEAGHGAHTEGNGSNGSELPKVLPKRFKSLVPRLKDSDYDYIIFDMPPVSQISLTPRLARFMDMVLMVVEAEKTDAEVVQRAGSLLAESKASVGVVLNKARNYMPGKLVEDL